MHVQLAKHARGRGRNSRRDAFAWDAVPTETIAQQLHGIAAEFQDWRETPLDLLVLNNVYAFLVDVWS